MLWVNIAVAALLVILLGFLAARLIWNVRLYKYQKKSGIERSKLNKRALTTNIATMSLLLVVGVFSIVGGSVINSPDRLSFKPVKVDNVVYESAKMFSNSEEFEEVFQSIAKNERGRFRGFRFNNIYRTDSAKGDIGTDAFSPTNTEGSYQNQNQHQNQNENLNTNKPKSDTYNQVAGVAESDIAKIHKSGNYFLYGPTLGNCVYKVGLDEFGNHIGTYEEQVFQNFQFMNMLLYEDILVVLGFDTTPIDTETDYHGTIYQPFSSSMYYRYRTYWTYHIIDTNTFEVIKSEELDWLIDTRLVDNMLYLFVNEYVPFDEEGKLATGKRKLDVSNTYYFKGELNSLNISRIYSIDLSDPELKTEKIGFVGDNQTFYMGNGLIVLINHKWREYYDLDRYVNTSQIVVVSYDETGKMEYLGSREVEGYVLNQYFLDVYEQGEGEKKEKTIRVVTTYGKDRRNHLYILKTQKGSDNLELLSTLYKGLGKPGEDVKSVTFNKNICKVVTFQQTDPLYTIDLSDPKNPKIVSEIEEPGYSSVLYIWDEENNTIGFGFIVEDNRNVGIKVSAYRTGDTEPTQTIEFRNDDPRFGSYVWANVTYNPREHLLVSKESGIIGFIVNHHANREHYESAYRWIIVAHLALFDVDFSQENPLTLNEPLFEKEFIGIEKLLLINETIHLLSPLEDATWNITQNILNEPLKFAKEETATEK